MKTISNKAPKWKIALMSVEALVVALYLIVTVFYVWYKTDRNGLIKAAARSSLLRGFIENSDTAKDYEKNVQNTDFDSDKIDINEGLKGNVETYMNIALFGIDSRGDEFDSQTHSDTIMVVSINNKTGEVKIASVFRDTMLKITDKDGDVSYTKANAGFFKGGPEGAINMLNTNLDLNITDYAVVNFTGLTKIIDALGGIDVTISPDEMFYINGYLTETRQITGLDAPDLTSSGTVHLSGLQATAFCRIRYVSFTDEDGTVYNNDMGRTARQRCVIKKIVEKAQAAGPDQVMSIVDSILHYNTEDEKIITTSFSLTEIMDLIPTVLDFKLSDSTGFPYTCATPTINGASMVVAQGLSYNVTKLHKFLFDEDNYVPSDTVQTISDYLISYTGIPTVKLEEDEVNDIYSSDLSSGVNDDSDSDSTTDSNTDAVASSY
ncbi:transcriptional attenuator, LytR family [Lachnospiraceae bacterium RM5]|nr:transcriptional attenuator, LytR family [Lachnospiraceae bacterium RM5]